MIIKAGVLALVIALATSCASEADGTNTAETTEAPGTTAEEVETTEAPTTTAAPTTTTVPPPAIYEGSGTQVVEIALPVPGEAAAATITHTGGGNFAVWELDANLQQVDLLVNTIGDYAGVVAVNMATTTSSLEITAGGAWRVEINPLLAVRRFDAEVTGTGDDVVVYTGDAQVVALAHEGDSNFAIWFYGDDGGDLLVNQIGVYSATVPLGAGPAMLEISANGPWSITPT